MTNQSVQSVFPEKVNDIQTRYRMFEVKFLAPGYSRGSRIQIKDLRHGTKITIQNSGGRLDDQAIQYFKMRQIPISALGIAYNREIYLTEDFVTPLRSEKETKQIMENNKKINNILDKAWLKNR